MSEVRKTRTELKRQSIVEAAKVAFKEYGVDATSMDKLAELAQVSKRTVYNHFASKEALVMHLLADLWTQAMVQIDVQYDAEQDLESQLFNLLMEEVNLVGGAEYIDLARVAFGHYLFKPEAIQAELAKFSEEETALTKWLKRAVSDKRLAISDVDFAFAQLHNLLKGSCFWPQLVQIAPFLNQAEKESLVHESVAMFMARYKVS